jgi:outer membrane beta-barrel protein
MNRMNRLAPLAGALAGILTLSLPAVAGARKSPLTGQPAVRHKEELRKGRFEVAPTFEGSVAADYQHTLSGGLKAEYHLSDTLAIGGLIFFGAAITTALFDSIEGSLPNNNSDYPTPSTDQAKTHVNSIPLHGGVHATFTPWFGKMALFGKSFLSYDIYFSGGFGFAQTSNTFDKADDFVETVPMGGTPDPRNDGPHNAGFQPGAEFGGGLHVYFNRWIALDLSMRDYWFKDNPSGLDNTGDFKVTDADRAFTNHLFVGVGVSFMLPPKAKISR